jgi:hypothetical protein
VGAGLWAGGNRGCCASRVRWDRGCAALSDLCPPLAPPTPRDAGRWRRFNGELAGAAAEADGEAAGGAAAAPGHGAPPAAPGGGDAVAAAAVTLGELLSTLGVRDAGAAAARHKQMTERLSRLDALLPR